MGRAYSWFAYIGLAAVSGSMLMGFRHSSDATAGAYVWNAALFVAYMAIHYVMMLPAFKTLVSGRPEGSMRERQLYVSVAIATWVLLYAVHRPLPGPGYELPGWLTFLGTCGFLLSFLAFLEGATFESMKGMLGIPGGEQTHTATAETPLLREGSYASVRHPMYRGFVFISLCSVIVNPNAAQLCWALVVAAGFVLFIPIEEGQLIRARGDEYQGYMKETPYRLLRGIW